MAHLTNLPTLTVIKHSKCMKTCQNSLKSHGVPPHDPPITDFELPVTASQTLMLDLAINEENSDLHRILIVSSPFRRCLETAVIVAQTMGVPAIQVHYGLTERVSLIRDSGWDWECLPLYTTENEMRSVVCEMSRNGERRGYCKVTIEEFVGKKLSTDDINEAIDMACDRIGTALEDIRNSIVQPGDHAIAIGHSDTLHALVTSFGPSGIEILQDKHCGFVTVKTMSTNCYWIAGRSRVKIAGEV